METKKEFEVKFQEVCDAYVLNENKFASLLLDVITHIYEEMRFHENPHLAFAFRCERHVSNAICEMLSHFTSIAPTEVDDEVAKCKQYLQGIVV